ncbi:MAG TPA: alanine--tRNA ligase [bacterium]|nr:alanine--tRNA ligase [bacterium]
MASKEIRRKFLEFMESKGHKIAPSSSLVPENDPSVLFTTAGMQQFKQYYLNPGVAKNSRIATSQKCVRTVDIDEVGDSTHLTFFEMLGNFSFGYPNKENSYFKKETIEYAWEFLTEELGVDRTRIYATYFKGEKGVPEDKESLELLKTIKGLKEIKPQGFEDNFWSLGTENSPGGPTVEFYIDGIEIWNCVFNEYVFRNGKYEPAENKGVDTGMGLERLATIMQGKDNVYETDLFTPIIKKIELLATKSGVVANVRIIADHIKASVFIIADGVVPSNVGRGYVLRRLIRRAVRYGKLLGIVFFTSKIAESVIEIYKDVYPEIKKNKEKIFGELGKEEEKFGKTLEKGLQEIIKFEPKFNEATGFLEFGINGQALFDIYQTYGFPLEMSLEELDKIYSKHEIGIPADFKEDLKKWFEEEKEKWKNQFQEELKKHQKLSKTASAGMFKGGLADSGEEAAKLHTATHLLQAALREVLGEHVTQKGSNITAERLRFDFSHPEKLTDEQKKKVEEIVNEKIKENLPVVCEEMSVEEAKEKGALGVFDEKYGDKVKVYSIGDFSKEICGGPHIKSTGELGHFEIKKEEASSAGIRRIKSVLE